MKWKLLLKHNTDIQKLIVKKLTYDRRMQILPPGCVIPKPVTRVFAARGKRRA